MVKSSRRRGGVRVGTETGIAFHDGRPNSVRRENVAGTHWEHKTRLCPCLFQFDGFDERGQHRTSRAHRGRRGSRVQPSFSAHRHSRATPIYYERLARVAGIVANERRRDFAGTNRFFPKDRCTLPNQMSFLLVHSWSAFVLAKGDRHGANKNEIVIFVFSVTTKGFSHARAPGWKRGDPLRVGSLASALIGVNPVFRVRPSRKLHSREQDLTAYKSSRVSWLGRFRRVY
jgi:hypothetical protein